MDPKTATKLEEVDLLRLQNLALRRQALEVEMRAMSGAIAAKYKGEGETIAVNQDNGDIIRTPEESAAP